MSFWYAKDDGNCKLGILQSEGMVSCSVVFLVVSVKHTLFLRACFDVFVTFPTYVVYEQEGLLAYSMQWWWNIVDAHCRSWGKWQW